MAAAYHRAGLTHTATFELFTRRLRPARRGYWIAAGLEQALDYLEGLRFRGEDIDFLRRLPAFEGADHEDFFARLAALRFEGEVWAVPEGTPVFPWEPLLRVSAPALQAQIVETYLLSLINFQTLIASKAARVAQATRGKPFVDFGTRRAHGPEAAELAARAAYVGGAVGTSNVEAARRLGLPAYGTFAHSWVMSFDDEDEAFRRYAEAFPQNTTLLIDTYDTVAAARRIVERDLPCQAVRLDSGDLAALSREVRRILDEGGRSEVKIVASSDLNEDKIDAMERAGCAVDIYGVGTELVTSKDWPALGGVYKLVEQRGPDGGVRYPIKLSSSKRSWPGRKQVYRRSQGALYAGDLIALADEEGHPGAPLLEKVLEGGRRLRPSPPLPEVRERCLAEVARLPEGVRNLAEPAEYPVVRSEALVALAERAYEELRHDAR
ncbi:MAG: nicotinate phosphoribosyltransferase [Planctomycetota bacterium]|nr:MAG: nicotinate phosphoribosyltransferase [Planctomycetota bacterium]